MERLFSRLIRTGGANLQFAFFFLFPVFLHAQLRPVSPVTELVRKYKNFYKTERELIYTHFNKTVFSPGEPVWFNCYITDATKHTPFLGTKNLYAELYNSAGNCIRRQILYVYGGVAYGHMDLPDTISTGQYFFKAYTSWARNFGDKAIFTQTIIITADTIIRNRYPVTTNQPYRIAFFPEGGYLLAGTEQKLAVRLTDNNDQGVAASAVFKTGDEIPQPFTTNAAGIGHFRINTQTGKKYVVQFFLPDGSIVEEQLPAVRERGVTLTVNKNGKDSLTIFINSNQQSKDLLTENFYLLMHRQGIVGELFELNFGNRRKLRIDQALESLPAGVCFLSLFDSDLKLVTERPVYIQKDNPASVLLDVQTTRRADSVTFRITAKDAEGKPAETSFSMSFLPASAEREQFHQNILTAVHIENGIGTAIDNHLFYPGNVPPAFSDDTDDLLLTCKDQMYDWDKIAAHTKPDTLHRFEQGFTVSGYLPGFRRTSAKDTLGITLMSPENNLVLSAAVSDNGTFRFPYLFLSDSATLYFYADSEKMKKRFRDMTVSVEGVNFDSAGIVRKRLLPVMMKQRQKDQPLPGDPKYLSLAEVKVKSKAKKKNPFHANIFSMVTDKVYTLDETTFRKYRNLTDILRGEFLLNVYHDSVMNVKIDMGRGSISFSGNSQPVLIIDGMTMYDLNMINMLNIDAIEAIAVNKTGNSTLGMRGASGSILIKTKEFSYRDDGMGTGTLIKKITTTGYAVPPFFSPHLYPFQPADPWLAKYAAIFWKPDVQTGKDGKTTFSIYLPEVKGGIYIRSEGISAKGLPVFDERKLE